MTRKMELLTQSESSWSDITYSLSRANNLQEGHYAERLWASMITPREVISSVSTQIRSMYKYRENKNAYRGMLIADISTMGKHNINTELSAKVSDTALVSNIVDHMESFDSTKLSEHKTRAVIHMGPHKTASTTIQFFSRKFKDHLQLDGYEMPWNAMETTGFRENEKIAQGPLGSLWVNQAHFASCFISPNNSERQVHWCDPDLLLHGLDIAQKKRNIFISAETFDEIDQEGINILQPYLSNWDEVTIVVYYRRYYDWIVSVYNERNKNIAISLRQSMLEYLAPPIDHPPYITNLIDLLTTKFNARKIVVKNMHEESQVNIAESFYCDAMPDATHTCDAIRAETIEDGHEVFTVNKARSFDYDDLALGAMKAGMIQFNETDKNMTSIITKAIQDHQEKTLKLERNDFHRLCPPEEVLNDIWKKSLMSELKLFPKSDIYNLRNDFKVCSSSKLCVVDVEKTMKEATWQSFFKSLNVMMNRV